MSRAIFLPHVSSERLEVLEDYLFEEQEFQGWERVELIHVYLFPKGQLLIRLRYYGVPDNRGYETTGYQMAEKVLVFERQQACI